MFGIGGFFTGSSVLFSGLAGTGKSRSGAASPIRSCDRGERCLYFAFEEFPDQVVRNMRSAGIDLQQSYRPRAAGVRAARPSLYGLEMHLARMHRDIEQFRPSAVVVDPIGLPRPFDRNPRHPRSAGRHLQDRGITAVFTSLSLFTTKSAKRPGRVVADGHLDFVAGYRSRRRT